MAKTTWVGALAPAALLLVTAGCSSEPEAPVETAPEAPEGISVADGRMNLPAVSGNPAAVYFTITNDGAEMQMIRSVHVEGAESAMLHETSEWSGQVDMQELTQVAVEAGETLAFAPGGKHVMAMNVDPALQPGGEVEVTLTFVRGDKVSFPARVLAPGDEG
ncbi:copper chaperone PCu(A)C [Alteraurantiacibacter buctensis]|uniref:Copper chaperone PCu(A)C n=1 Tax=Alteraurantiacibacter buctensis TaxID=1503981 RepID=A0A844YV17_9SPHN|nr:copper chaperone PCu(A)C [Alteraurantiacibacter buctensis]MXO72185.1 copper chaperone PCu(A)C [Alteraurantiacibacter buctensis]